MTNPINVEVREPESIIIVSAILLDAKRSSIRENMNGTLVSFFILEVEGDSDLGMVFQVPHQKAGLPCFQYDDLPVRKHPK